MSVCLSLSSSSSVSGIDQYISLGEDVKGKEVGGGTGPYHLNLYSAHSTHIQQEHGKALRVKSGV